MNLIGTGGTGALTGKVRSMAKPVPVTLTGEWLRFDNPEYGVALGQAAVLYSGERVIGGGWIDETVAAEIA
jgi:tRNA-specific 2-thiouridylase